MSREHSQSEEFEHGSWNLDDFMRSQSEALYLQTREEALSSWGSGAPEQRRIGERREGFDRRSSGRRESQRHDVPERRSSERRGQEGRISGGTSP